MESMLPGVLALVGIPLFGFLVSIVMIRSAKRELESDGVPVDPTEKQARTAKLMVLSMIGGTKVMYGALQAFYLAAQSGALTGADNALSTPDIDLVMYCGVCSVLNLIAVLADGMLVANGVQRGALTSPEAFPKVVIKAMLPELIAVCGLAYAILTLM